MSLGLNFDPQVTVARVSGITGTHAAANGDYYFDTVLDAWLKDGISGNFDQGIEGYSIQQAELPLAAGWTLTLGNFDTYVSGQTATPAVDDPWDVVDWGDTGLFTEAAGASGITVVEATAVAKPLSVGKSTLSNPLLPTETTGTTAEPSLSPGAAVAQVAVPSLSPGAAVAQTTEPSLSPGALNGLTAQGVTGAGYPGLIFVNDTGGVSTGGVIPLDYNASGDEYQGAVGAEVWLVRKVGGFWTVAIDGSNVSTGPADSISPVGSYTGGEAFTVSGVAPVRGSQTAEPTLSPSSPGALIS